MVAVRLRRVAATLPVDAVRTGTRSTRLDPALHRMLARAWRPRIPGYRHRADCGTLFQWIPACFRHAARALRAARYPILRVPVRSSRAVAEQGAHIVRNLYARLPADRRFIVLTHSKGGLDALAALHADSGLRARCDGIALVQPPVGPSAIVDGLLEQRGRASIPHGWVEPPGDCCAHAGCMQARAISAAGATRASRSWCLRCPVTCTVCMS